MLMGEDNKYNFDTDLLDKLTLSTAACGFANQMHSIREAASGKNRLHLCKTLALV
jgi:hypothetical protein